MAIGNVNSRMVVTLIEYLQRAENGYARYVQMGYSAAEPIPERRWRGLPARDLARLLKSWCLKQIRSHFDRLQQRGLVTVEREQANGPLRYRLPRRT